jgi:TatD DNase family protein
MIQLIDSHSHLDVVEFDADREAVLSRSHAAGVVAQIVPATTAASWPIIRDMCSAAPELFPAFGLHPTFLHDHRPEHFRQLREWLERDTPVAVGECGLDYWVEGLDRDGQRRCFEVQLELAGDLGLPLIIHARKAYDDVTAALRRVGGLRGVVHSFSGSPSQAEQLWKLGFHLGIGGPVTYPRANRLRKLVASMPIEFLLVETDSPDQPIHGHQGRRNEPARLVDVVSEIARLRGESVASVAASTASNACGLFGIDLSTLV